MRFYDYKSTLRAGNLDLVLYKTHNALIWFYSKVKKMYTFWEEAFSIIYDDYSHPRLGRVIGSTK